MTAALTDAPQAGPARKLRLPSQLVALPFLGYVAVFFLLPTLIVVFGAFRAPGGGVGTGNLSRLSEPNVVDALVTSLGVSFVSALIGSIVGAVAAYVLVANSTPNSWTYRVITSISSVLAQFGGVMLAFAFIATLGMNGLITKWLAAIGITLDPNWLSTLPGLVTVYCYFQIPLMIIVFVPAVSGLRPQWREVTANLGGNTWTYWLRVAGPLLWPAWAGSFLLLFANAFSAFATAAALYSQRSILLPLMIQGALRNEQDLTQAGFAQTLALLMVVIVGVVMSLYAWLQRRTAKWL